MNLRPSWEICGDPHSVIKRERKDREQKREIVKY